MPKTNTKTITTTDDYLAGLPKKRMGVGCLFLDQHEKMLILKPTYKDHWLMPGGVIEANESPREACIREVKEETGIKFQPTRLLCVDYVSDRSRNLESVQFIFSGGMIDSKIKIILPQQEISSYQFLSPKKVISLLGVHSQARLSSCLPYLSTKKTIYLENGNQP